MGEERVLAKVREEHKQELCPNWTDQAFAVGSREQQSGTQPMSSRSVEDMTACILAANRKRLFGSAAVFERHSDVSDARLDDLERGLGQALPRSLRSFLLMAGYGDINHMFSFRQEWFTLIDRGELAGHVMFAQDDCGNFYAFGPVEERIYFLCRSSPEYAPMADGFCAFLDELERRSFDLQEWTDSLVCEPYRREN